MIAAVSVEAQFWPGYLLVAAGIFAVGFVNGRLTRRWLPQAIHDLRVAAPVMSRAERRRALDHLTGPRKPGAELHNRELEQLRQELEQLPGGLD